MHFMVNSLESIILKLSRGLFHCTGWFALDDTLGVQLHHDLFLGNDWTEQSQTLFLTQTT